MHKFSTAKTVAQNLPKHEVDIYKYQRGKVLEWCGSDAMRGTASLCAKAAFMAGAGYVHVFTEEKAALPLSMNLPEAVIENSTGDDFCFRFKAAARNCRSMLVGPGIGVNQSNQAKLEWIIKTALVPIVIDADALMMLSGNLQQIKCAYTMPVITPHGGEMASLLQLPLVNVNANREELAIQFAQTHNCVVLLKGANTVIAAPDNIVAINPYSNSKMATAGSGDVLSGIIAALIAQGVDSYFAAVCGSYIHGEAADLASKSGKRNIIASNISEFIAKAIEAIEKSGAN